MNSKKEATSYKANGIVQANIEKCVEIIESSFLKDYFSDSLTDIQYNGDTFYAQDNEIGRFKLEIEMDNDDVLAIIKHIVKIRQPAYNLGQKQTKAGKSVAKSCFLYSFLYRFLYRKIVDFILDFDIMSSHEVFRIFLHVINKVLFNS